MLKNIVFGGATFAGTAGGYALGDLENCKPDELLDYSIAMGIEYFDFAPIYGFDHAEKTFGSLIGDRREKVKIISKAGVDWHDSGRVNMDNSPKVISKMFEKSLKNFNSDFIDIYFIHWPDKKTDIRYSVEVLENLKAKGKIKQIGLSNTDASDFEKAMEVSQIEYVQSECNLFNQEAYFPDSTLKMGWGTFDKGILTSSVTLDRQFKSHDARSHAFWWKKSNWKKRVQFVDKMKDKYNLNHEELKSIALHYSHNQMNLSIIGFKSPAQLDDINNLLKKEKHNDYEKIVHEFSLF